MWNNSPALFNAGAWLLWLLVAMLGALGTRNPFYLALMIVVGLAVNVWLGRVGATTGQDPARRGFGVFMRAVLLLLLAVAILKGLSNHIGATVLFTLPDWLPQLGGPITLEGLASAGLDALSLLAVLAVFAAFSAGADYYAILRGVPPAMRQVGLVTSIAITFVPQTVLRFSEIREAQALRGHRVRRVGDLVPLAVPMLAGGMERSMDLAEAMEARGYSRNADVGGRIPPVLLQSRLAFGLGGVLAGAALLALMPSASWVGWTLIVASVGLFALTLKAVGAGSKRSRYRRSVWRERDTLLTIILCAVLAILLTYKLIAPASLTYDPISRLTIYMPPFDPVVAGALAGLLAPILVGGKRQPGKD